MNSRGPVARKGLSHLSPEEWAEIKLAIQRGVTPGEIYMIPEIAYRYTLRGFYRAVENRLGSIEALRREARRAS
jgi:hypothetical protein